MLGNLGELAKLMSCARDIQNSMQKLKEELPTLEFSATVPGDFGTVQVTVRGDFTVKSVVLPAGVDAARVAEAVREATDTALTEARDTIRERVKGLTGGLGIDLPML